MLAQMPVDAAVPLDTHLHDITAMRGNVLDLAVGVIIGASFTGIVTSLVNDIIMPPLIEGDIFTVFVEGAGNSRLGPCAGNTQRGTCKVSYVHTGTSNVPGPLAWTDTLLMVNTPSGWRVDDVAYDPGFAFGNSGRLSQTLAMIRSEAR